MKASQAAQVVQAGQLRIQASSLLPWLCMHVSLLLQIIFIIHDKNIKITSASGFNMSQN